ncbi:hypothetical protein SAM23877_6222 [Streptomyces ambofaciens ATCC 23877]|uniref:Uncharacterized protein n=1 Tax=Streptomyces ambofaciens (strain ATCC 23877 / 3486 / DSM 40053 / JCM 4204 / NBRC 12836 / NRRL B-2516) TaxID=278992 RepID=A0A0K2B2E4_STRA7|nr:hypothetical protein SAM23877_6222 [Streptomyces ambofaciens ATCC 23877]
MREPPRTVGSPGAAREPGPRTTPHAHPFSGRTDHGGAARCVHPCPHARRGPGPRPL